MFSWLKNDRPLLTNHGPAPAQVTITSVDEFSSILNIARLERGHAGNYTCLASNEAGETQFTAILDVQGDCFGRTYF